MGKSYIYKEFKNYEYQDFISNESIELIIAPFTWLEIENTEIISFTKNYNTVIIPVKILNHLKFLLERYRLADLESDFISLICGLQYVFYIYYEQDYEAHPLLKDFVNARKQKRKIVDALNLYKSDTKIIDSIQFNPLLGKAIKIDNWFLKDDIFKALISYYGITDNNYDTIIDDENSFNFKKASGFWIYTIGNQLYSFLLEKDFIQSDVFRFIDYFLKIAQIENPSQSKQGSVELYDDLDENLNLSIGEIKALRQQFRRKRNFSI